VEEGVKHSGHDITHVGVHWAEQGHKAGQGPSAA
jgi:hypothetical protein